MKNIKFDLGHTCEKCGCPAQNYMRLCDTCRVIEELKALIIEQETQLEKYQSVLDGINDISTRMCKKCESILIDEITDYEENKDKQ